MLRRIKQELGVYWASLVYTTQGNVLKTQEKTGKSFKNTGSSQRGSHKSRADTKANSGSHRCFEGSGHWPADGIAGYQQVGAWGELSPLTWDCSNEKEAAGKRSERKVGWQGSLYKQKGQQSWRTELGWRQKTVSGSRWEGRGPQKPRQEVEERPVFPNNMKCAEQEWWFLPYPNERHL